jgi:hypothetical protein
VGGYAPRARGDSVRPRRFGVASGQPLNFTVRRHSVDAALVDSLVDSELAASCDPRVAQIVARLRITPRLELRHWDYPPPDSHECWVVLEDLASQTAIAYCGSGFGPKCPWGLLGMLHSGRRQDMGDDSQWFPTLAMAVRDSVAWDE